MKAAWAREMEDVVLGAVCYSGLSPETVSLWVPHVSCKAESHVCMVQVSAVGLICLVLPRGSECMSNRDGWGGLHIVVRNFLHGQINTMVSIQHRGAIFSALYGVQLSDCLIMGCCRGACRQQP